MKKPILMLVSAVVAAAGMSVALAGKDEPKPFVHIPKSWDAAVEEAKTLNVPIVVHSHGWN